MTLRNTFFGEEEREAGMPSPSNENRDISKAELWKSLAIQAQKGDQRAYGALLRDILPYIKSVLTGGLANPDWIDVI
jgi:hypothetical protein